MLQPLLPPHLSLSGLGGGTSSIEGADVRGERRAVRRGEPSEVRACRSWSQAQMLRSRARCSMAGFPRPWSTFYRLPAPVDPPATHDCFLFLSTHEPCCALPLDARAFDRLRRFLSSSSPTRTSATPSTCRIDLKILQEVFEVDNSAYRARECVLDEVARSRTSWRPRQKRNSAQ